MGDTIPFTMAKRLELRWQSVPLSDLSGSCTGYMDVSGIIDISGTGCCDSYAEFDVYLNGLIGILTQLNSRADVTTADNRFEILINTLTSRLGQL